MFGFVDDLDFNPNHVERMLKDFSESLKRSEDEKESLTNDLQSAESKLSELIMEVKSLQKKLEEADKVCQASDRAKARLEQQFERTQETIRLQVSLSFCAAISTMQLNQILCGSLLNRAIAFLTKTSNVKIIFLQFSTKNLELLQDNDTSTHLQLLVAPMGQFLSLKIIIGRAFCKK